MYYSQNGYSVLNSTDDCKYYELKNTYGVVVPLRRDNCGYVLANFARKFHDKVENLNKTDCHGFNRRRISGSSEWSNHASGTAIDLNATKHVYGDRNSFNSFQMGELRKLLADYDDVIRWGGDYNYSVDEMHFEIDRNYQDVTVVAQRMRRNNTVRLDRMRFRARNIDIYMVKRELKQRGFFDGELNTYFGKNLKRAYADWQTFLGYTGNDADGIPGRVSLEELGFKVK